MLAEQLNHLIIQKCLYRIHGIGDIGQSSARRLLQPFLRIAIAIKNDSFMLHIGSAYQLMHCRVEILCLLQLIRKFLQLLCHNRVQGKIRTGNGCRGRRHAEFKFIPCKGKGRGSVSVRCVLFQCGQRVYTNPHSAALQAACCSAMLNLVENILQLVAKKDGNDCRRCLLRAETMIVAGVGCRKAQQFRVFIHALDNRAQKYKELCIFMRCFPRIKQILPIIRAQRPVYMLAAAVHACEGLFVQQAGHIMVSGNSLHCLHN